MVLLVLFFLSSMYVVVLGPLLFVSNCPHSLLFTQKLWRFSGLSERALDLLLGLCLGVPSISRLFNLDCRYPRDLVQPARKKKIFLSSMYPTNLPILDVLLSQGLYVFCAATFSLVRTIHSLTHFSSSSPASSTIEQRLEDII